MEGRDWSSIRAPSICRAGSATREGAGGGEDRTQALLRVPRRDQNPHVLNPGATTVTIAMEKLCSQHTLPHGCS